VCAKQYFCDGTEGCQHLKEGVWIWVDLSWGTAIALEDFLDADIGCLGCHVFQVNECCCLGIGEFLQCKWGDSMVDVVNCGCVVELSGLEVPDEVWVDGVLHVKVGTLCSFQEGVVDVEMATVHVCLPKHQPEWWEWFSVCETTPA